MNLSLHPSKYHYLIRHGYLSPTGRCRPFGAGADGMVPSEGVGVVVLKPLARALADGDPIRAVIKGGAMNHGGKVGGFTVPSPIAQAELVRRALADARVPASSIGYLEAHGTGTALGDPIEIEGLADAFRGVTGLVPIGSSKSNFGHAEAAAGVLGLTKAILQLEHRTLVPSIHADPPNPAIDLRGLPLRVLREVSRFEGGPRRAGVSSFGAGGVNVHLVIEEAPPVRPAALEGPEAFPLSAATDGQLRELAGRLLEHARTRRDGRER